MSLCLIFYSKVRPVLQVVRFFMSVTLGLSAVAGAVVAGAEEHPSLWMLFLAGFLTAAGGFALNDFQDFDRDLQADRKPLVRGDLRPANALHLAVFLLLGGLTAGVILGLKWFLLGALQVILLSLYSRLKRASGILANTCTAGLCASGIVYGGLSHPGSAMLWQFAMSCFIFVVGREVLKDILDLEDDRLAGLKTVPLLFGSRISRLVPAALILLGGALALHVCAQGEYLLGGACSFLSVISIAATMLYAGFPGAKTLGSALNLTAAAMLSLTLTLSLPV